MAEAGAFLRGTDVAYAVCPPVDPEALEGDDWEEWSPER